MCMETAQEPVSGQYFIREVVKEAVELEVIFVFVQGVPRHNNV